MAGATELIATEVTEPINKLSELKLLIDEGITEELQSKTRDILQIFGGIDGILNEKINHNLLNETQIDQLHELLLPPSLEKATSTVAISVDESSGSDSDLHRDDDPIINDVRANVIERDVKAIGREITGIEVY